MERPSLSRASRLVVGLHVLVALVFAIIGVVDTGGGDGWSDLARFVTLLLAAVYLLAVGTVAAISRYAMSSEAVRIVALLLGPPALMVVAVLAIRG